MASARLIRIDGKAPAARQYEPGSAEFRYWVAAEALRRAADFWGATLPNGTRWHPTNGARLPVRLDQGIDLNAFYDRHGLHFFHETMKGITVFSGMIASTCLAVLFVPTFFVVIQRFENWLAARSGKKVGVQVRPETQGAGH